jgi:hypothetical protein
VCGRMAIWLVIRAAQHSPCTDRPST